MPFDQLKRRDFIALLGSAAAWPLAATAQQPERVRRIGVLTPFAADDPEAKARVEAFVQALQQLGWSVGRNLQIDIRWGAGMPSALAITRQNWWRSHRTPFWPQAARLWVHCSRQHEACRSCSR